MYSGWADPIGPPLDAIDYYTRVVTVIGGQRQTNSFFRLFMVPGMAHCGGGPGPNLFGGFGPPSSASKHLPIDPEHDVLSAVTRWVEKDVAPDHIIASHVKGDRVDRTRPLCPYPSVARWSGSGDSNDAANFACTEMTEPRAGRRMHKGR